MKKTDILIDALIKISNLSYTDIRFAVERYELDGDTFREHATERD